MISKLLFGLALCVSLLLVGCGKSNPMVGSWKLAVDDSIEKKLPAGMKMPSVTIEFKADDTFKGTAEVFGKTSISEGTYKLDGKTLTLTMVTEDGKPSKEAPQTVTLAEDMKSFDMPGSNGQGKMVKQ